MITRTISLCSGAGALELGIPSAVLVVAETDPAASRVLAERFPSAPNFGDITQPWTDVPTVDRVLAGVPCQPVSEGGLKLGADDPRWLGAAFLERVRLARPWEVFLENVENLSSVRFTAEREQIIKGLTALGYSVRWGVMGACTIGAPHCRHRFYLHAVYGHGFTAERVTMPACNKAGRVLFPSPRAGDGIRGAELNRAGRTGTGGTLADAVVSLFCSGTIRGAYATDLKRWEDIVGRDAPVPVEPARTQSGVRLAAPFSEWLMGWPAGWVTDLVDRKDALRIIGNGVVPQAVARAYEILKSAH
jgi:DNA (cytosine-5)-methyltransferase 1